MADRSEFHTRQYRYPARPHLAGAAAETHAAGTIYRFLLGADPAPVPVDPATVKAQWHDPFAQLVLAAGPPLPMTLRALLAALDAANAEPRGLPAQTSFVAADGGQIPWSPKTADLQRQIRFVITRATRHGVPGDLLISTGSDFNSPTTFLQVISWDPTLRAYRFYDRRNGAWIFAGSSWDALVVPTRGQGPFDSHVNGALNMKELKAPWPNWHSQSAGIRDDILAPNDPLRRERLWIERTGAEEFERTFIRPGIERWVAARFAGSLADNRLGRFPEFMRHLLLTTTVNLTSSSTENGRVGDVATIDLPLPFFLNADALLNTLDLEPDIAVPQVPADLYRACLAKFEVAVGDGYFRFPGDTHFVFTVPEPAFEDVAVLKTLLAQKVISGKLAACLLMVDFANPVFSPRRATLLQYSPAAAPSAGSGDLPDFVAAVRQAAAALPGTSPEAEFLGNWQLADGDWRTLFAKRIEKYMAKLAMQLQTASGVESIFRLAESRRREFRKRPLAEFRLTTPMTNIPEGDPLLQLAEDAAVISKP